MKANETHISLKTAKLLKDCGVDSKYLFDNLSNLYTNEIAIIRISDNTKQDEIIPGVFYPAYTWQEILWEHAKEFFGNEQLGTYNNNDFYYFCEDIELEDHSDNENFYYIEISSKRHARIILNFLQENKYEEADLYFRENCILIKK